MVQFLSRGAQSGRTPPALLLALFPVEEGNICSTVTHLIGIAVSNFTVLLNKGWESCPTLLCVILVRGFLVQKMQREIRVGNVPYRTQKGIDDLRKKTVILGISSL